MRSPRASRNGTSPRSRLSEDRQAARWVLEYVRRRSRVHEDDGAECRAGDRSLTELKERIAAHHAPLVESIARKFTGGGEPLEDLIQEGQVGLLTALESFDPVKGVKFSTYATHFIAGTIRHFLRDKGRIIKEPSWLRDLSRRVEHAVDQLTVRLNRTPHAAEVAEMLDLPETMVEEVLATRLVFQVLTLSETAEPGLLGVIDSDRAPAWHDGAGERLENRLLIDAAMDRLKAIECRVLHEFFYAERSQAEIARHLGISGNYVSFLLRHATQKMRRVLTEAELRERARLREHSVIDPATGLHTAAYLAARLDEHLSLAARIGKPTAVLGLQVFGLPEGGARAEALGACGETVRRSIRRMDLVGRGEGDDSLVVVLPETGSQATVVESRLLQVVPAAHPALALEVRAAWHPDHGRTAHALLLAVGLRFSALPDAA